MEALHTTKARSFVEISRTRSTEIPGKTAYIFLEDGESDERRLTYAEVDAKARAVAARLQDAGLQGERMLLLYPPGIDFITGFFGCLYAGAIAVPAYPPDPSRLERSLPRLEAIAGNCSAKMVLSNRLVCEFAGGLSEFSPSLAALPWVATDEIDPASASAWKEFFPTPEELAFLQYTSGSTGTPKGVMVSHGNLLANEELIRHAFVQDEHAVTLGWLPVYHDMGLIGNVLQPFFNGGHLVFMSPMAFLQRPVRWLKAMTRYRGTIAGAPNFAYDLCVRKVTPAMRDSLELSSWTVAYNGAEPVRAETMQRFTEAFAPCGFRPEAFLPCYGLAEGTLIVTGTKRSAPPKVKRVDAQALKRNTIVAAAEGQEAATLVCSGPSLPGEDVAIVDPDTLTEVPEGQVAEIWVRGPSVAKGYWDRPAESEQTFRAQRKDPDGARHGPYLRTGDLGFLDHGELYVTGRLKDMLIIRGQNHYPHDLEQTVSSSGPALRPGCVAAFSIEVEGEEKAVIAAEIAQELAPAELEELAGRIRELVVRAHDVQVYRVAFLSAGSMPKTSSGKLQRHACRRDFLAQTLVAVAVH